MIFHFKSKLYTIIIILKYLSVMNRESYRDYFFFFFFTRDGLFLNWRLVIENRRI